MDVPNWMRLCKDCGRPLLGYPGPATWCSYCRAREFDPETEEFRRFRDTRRRDREHMTIVLRDNARDSSVRQPFDRLGTLWDDSEVPL